VPSLLDLQRRVSCGPYDPDAYLELCQALVAEGNVGYAADIFDRWRHADPDNPAVAFYRSFLMGDDAPPRAPDGYLVREFDEFADSFDVVLRRLRYCVPERFGEILGQHLAGSVRVDVLDLGCGTGLCGAEARRHAARLVGVDLSAGMLERARGRQVYDDLVESELSAYLDRCERRFDVVMAGEALIYFGELRPVMERIASVTAPEGLLVFSLEATDADTFVLSRTGRYQHSRNYVESTLRESGWMVDRIDSFVPRFELDVPVDGLLGIARRSP